MKVKQFNSFFYFFSFLFLIASVSASATISGIPDFTMNTDDYFGFDVDDYGSQINDDATTLSFINPDSGAGVVLYGDVGGEHTNSYFTASLSTGGLIQFLSYDSTLDPHYFTIGVSNTSGSTQDGDSFLLTITEGEAPVQVASIPALSLGSSGTGFRGISNYFNNYDSVNLTFDNGAGNISLYGLVGGTTQTSNGDVNVSISSVGGALIITVVSNGNAFSENLHLVVANDYGSVTGSFLLTTVAESGEAPEQVASIPYFQYVDLGTDNWVSNFDYDNPNTDKNCINPYFVFPSSGNITMNVTVSDGVNYGSETHNLTYSGASNAVFYHFKDNFSSVLGSSSANVFALYNDFSTIGCGSGYESYLRLIPPTDWVSTYGSNYIHNFTITVEFSNVIGSDLITIFAQMSDSAFSGSSSGGGPEQIQSLNDISLNYNDLYTLPIGDLFLYYDNITFDFGGNGSFSLDVSGGGYNSLDTSYFTAELSEVVVNELTFYLVSKEVSSFFSPVTITACNDFGCTSLTTTLRISGASGGIEGDGIFAVLVNLFVNIFPDADTLTRGERYGAMFIFHAILTALIYFLGFRSVGISAGLNFVVLGLNAALFVAFMGMGYINFGVVLIVPLLLIGIYALMRLFR